MVSVDFRAPWHRLLETVPPTASSVTGCVDGKPKALTFQYTGDSCAATTNAQEGKFECIGDPGSLEPAAIRIDRSEERFGSGAEQWAALEWLSAPSRMETLHLEARGERSPYPGLASFTEADAAHLFGPETEVGALWKKPRRLPLLGIIGPSGAGNGSLSRAGLVPSPPTGWSNPNDLLRCLSRVLPVYETSPHLNLSRSRNQVPVWTLLAVLSLSLAPAVTLAEQPTATIRAWRGTVLLNGEEQNEAAVLSEGDVIETQAGAGVVLELSDGSLLEFGEHTTIELTATGMKSTATGVKAIAGIGAGVRPQFGRIGVTAKLGLLGFGGDVTVRLRSKLNTRLGFNLLAFGLSSDDDDLDTELDWQTMAVLLDWHPGEGHFRFSLGAMKNNNELVLSGMPSDTVELNDVEYELQSLDGKVTFESVAPYLGFGYGNAVNRTGRWHFAFDIGVMFQGSPQIDANAVAWNPALQPALDADLEAERRSIEEDFENVDLYPVLAFGFSYAF